MSPLGRGALAVAAAGLSLVLVCVLVPGALPGAAAQAGPAAKAAGKAAKPATPASDSAGSKKSGAEVLKLINEASPAGTRDDGPALKRKARRAKKAQARARRQEIVERERRQDEQEGFRLYRSQREAEAASGYRYPGWSGYPWAWGWYPNYGIPQTYVWRDYPPPITHTPRLGLQYNYPYAWQMGIRIPEDSSPLVDTPNLGPFVGVVQAAREQAELEQQQEEEETVSLEDIKAGAIDLMHKGKYRSAGRLLAGAFEASRDPQLPFLLAEVFFALGKPDTAEVALRYGLRARGAVKRLPREVAGHFAGREDFELKLKALVSSGKHDLLAGYLLVHSSSPQQGVDLLGKLATAQPQDKEAALLYRRFLKKAVTP